MGTLNISATEPDAFDPDEVKLLEELAFDLAYGIGPCAPGPSMTGWKRP